MNPVDVNGINKMAAEKYHLLYSDVYGIHATALRLTNTIGPRMRIKDARQTFVGLWIRQLLEQKPIEVWGGKQLRDFTDVEDAVDAFLLVAASPSAKGQVYNLGGSETIALEDLAKRMVEINGGGNIQFASFPRTAAPSTSAIITRTSPRSVRNSAGIRKSRFAKPSSPCSITIASSSRTMCKPGIRVRRWRIPRPGCIDLLRTG